MKLARQIKNLKSDQLHLLHDTMLVAGIVFENGGDWKEIFRKEKNRYAAGLMRRIYERLLTATREEIDSVFEVLTNRRA